MARIVVACGVSFGVVGGSGVFAQLMTPGGPSARTVQPGAAATTDNGAADVRQIEALLEQIEAAHRTTSRVTFDPQAVVETVGRDADALFAWVRDHTSLVPYRGALRGPVGVLMDRTGNSLDRALLLAEVLHVAGNKVRLARGTLDDAAAQKLAESLAGRKPAPVPTDDGARAAADPKADALKEAQERSAAYTKQVGAGVAEQTAKHAPQVEKLVAASAGTQEGEAAVRRAALADHWWAQREVNGQWVDLDPTDTDAKPGDKLAPSVAETFAYDSNEGRIPLDGKFCHEVEVRVLVEQWADGKLEVHPVLSHTLRPAEVTGRHVSLSHNPIKTSVNVSNPPPGDPRADDLKRAALGQTEWLPVLTVGEQLVYDKSFTHAGVVNEKPELNPAFMLGQGTNDAFGGFGASLGGGIGGGKSDSADPATVLTAEWVEYEIRVPGAEPQAIRRPLFDLVGPAARAAGSVGEKPAVGEGERVDRALVMGGRVEVLAFGASLTPEFVGSIANDTFLRNRRELLEIAQQGRNVPRERRVELARNLASMPGALHNVALARAAGSKVKDAVYLDRPNVFNHRARWRINENNEVVVRHEIDLVANPVAVRPGANVDAFAARVEQGVADTAAEAAVLEGFPAKNNTTGVFQAAAEAGAQPVVVRTAEDLKSAPLAIPDDAKARVAEDVAKGYAVVIPSKAVALGGAGDRTGWWRVDPRTGETIGIMDSGLHQTATEEAMAQHLNALAASNGQTVLLSASAFKGMTYGEFLLFLGLNNQPATVVLWNILVRAGFFLI